MKLVSSREKQRKYGIKPNLKDGFQFSKKLIAVEMKKTEIKMRKLLYLGQLILNSTKALMYKFYYNYMQPKNGSKVKHGTIIGIEINVRKFFDKSLSNVA